MARISEKEAERLGIILSGRNAAAQPSHSMRPGKISAKSILARGATAPARAPRINHKRGRLPVQIAHDQNTVSLSMFVPLEPIPKARARTTTPRGSLERAFVQARGNLQAFAALLDKVKTHTYTPERTASFESHVSMCANRMMAGREPIDRPVAMTFDFVFPGDPTTWPTDSTDGDLDNLEKAIKDALNGIVYIDDRLVVRVVKEKTCGARFGINLSVTTL